MNQAEKIKETRVDRMQHRDTEGERADWGGDDSAVTVQIKR